MWSHFVVQAGFEFEILMHWLPVLLELRECEPHPAKITISFLKLKEETEFQTFILLKVGMSLTYYPNTVRGHGGRNTPNTSLLSSASAWVVCVDCVVFAELCV